MGKESLVFSARLSLAMENQGFTNRELAKEVGVSEVAIGRYLKGRIPAAETLLKIAKTLGQNPYALVFREDNKDGSSPLGKTSKGILETDILNRTFFRLDPKKREIAVAFLQKLEEMQKEGITINWLKLDKNLNVSYEEGLSAAEEINHEEFVIFPLYDIYASMGDGSIVDEENVIGKLAFSKKIIEREGFDIDNLALIRAQGDSMEATIKDGDTLLIDHSIDVVRDDAIYVLRMDDMLVAKRLQRQLDGSVIIKSDNPKYNDQTVPKESAEALLKVIGRVVWIGRRV